MNYMSFTGQGVLDLLSKKSGLNLFLAALVFSLLAAAPASARQTTGGIKGQVTDQFGALVVGAVVTASGTDGRSQTATTNQSGAYSFRLPAPGRYLVRVEAPGFTVFEAADVSVAPQGTRTLDVQLEVTLAAEDVRVEAEEGLNTDPSSNADALVLRDEQLDALPDDPGALEATLQVLAGSAAPGGAQIQVDGMTGGRVPPKESIREIRINQNVVSAESDAPGGARIDILTKPGADQFHGSAFFNLSDESFNARNPFAESRAPYRYGLYGGTFSGPIIRKRASFFFDFQRRDEDENGIVSARGLDAELNVAPLNSSFVVPRRSLTLSPRFDYQLNSHNTLVVRYTHSRSNVSNLGVGELSLLERAYDSAASQHTFQLTETAVVNSRMINETRFQFVRDRRQREDSNSAPGIVVQDSFLAGGPGVGRAFSATDRFELLNYSTLTVPNHILRFGARLRRVHITDISNENYNGTFLFAGGGAPQLDAANQIVLGEDGRPVQASVTSLERYRRTLAMQRQGLSAAEIRERGGGPTQFSVSGGDPKVEVSQMDVGAFFQDQWQLRPNVTLSLGLRYEAQSNLDDWTNFAPRVSLAWAPGGGKSSGGKSPTVLRFGYGIFYDRFSEGNTLQALRNDGVRQQRFIITEPGLLDLFPSPPTADALAPFVQQQTRTAIADDLRATRTDFFLVSFERQLPRRTSVYATFTEYRSKNVLRRRNINAVPFAPAAARASAGARPFGDVGEIFLIESTNAYNNHQFITGLRSQLRPTLSVFANYMLTKAENGGEALAFPSDGYDLKSEWGPAAFDVRHRIYVGGNISVPRLKLTLNPLVIAFSGRPFNITSGRDTNSDRLFTDRPAFASARTAPQDLRRTPFGDFDLNPAPGQALIPRNFGRGPAFFSFNMGVSRGFAFGSVGGAKQGTQSSGKKAENRFKLTLSLDFQNLFNRANFTAPVGNLSSPFFGQSTRILGSSGFEAGGGSATPAFNRRVEMQVRLSF